MTFHIFTIFPESFKSYFATSILKRAQKKGFIKIKIYNIRDFAKGKHRITDDRPFGGGAGMVMKAEPIVKAVGKILSKIKNKKYKIIVFSAKGEQFNQKTAFNFSKKYTDILMVCGRYEGIDERVKTILKAQEVSVGPYILTGGEIAAAVIIDAISRHVPGVLGRPESLEEIKGSYPVYTRPEIFIHKGKKYRVPRILLSGNHEKIKQWRLTRGNNL